eukprot:XP_001690431.1 predicted protein [Chlamydomonas reinhardtii]
MSPPRLRGCSLALAALALGVLAASLLPNCPFRAAVNAQTRTSALGPIPDAIAAALGVQDGALTTAAGAAVDPAPLAAKLSARIQCSARLCVDMTKYAWHTDLADVNARVLLWSPKVPTMRAGQTYDPRGKDWVSHRVVAMCRELFKYEKRLASFFMRAAFHDSLAVDVSQCPGPNCGGADASLVLSLEEMARPENAEDNFAELAGRAAKKIASFYDVSVADTLAVCAAVAPEVLSKGRIKILTGSGKGVLRVGRLDSVVPAPPGNLPAANTTLEQFAAFWAARGISATEATALMGSHALIDDQACFQGKGMSDYCNPATADCSNVRMFRWENHYYKDICSPTLTVRTEKPGELDPVETPIVGMTDPEIDAEARRETCKFTSKEGRTMAMNRLALMRCGLMPEPVEPEDGVTVTWTYKNCRDGAAYGINVAEQCPHAHLWFYTPNDAYLGLACQGVGTSAAAAEVRSATRAFIKSQDEWDKAFSSAYIKMVTAFALWPDADGSDRKAAYLINGGECATGLHLEAACAQGAAGPASADALHAATYVPPSSKLRDSCKSCSQGVCPEPKQCEQCVKQFRADRRPKTNPLVTEANCCGCATLSRSLTYNATKDANGNTYVIKTDFGPLPAAAACPVPERQLDTFTFDDNVAPTVTIRPAGSNPPVAPEGDISDLCPAADGTIVEVRGYPSSPFRWKPFTQTYVAPPRAQVAASYARPGTNLTVDAYEIDIFTTARNIGCPGGRPTWFLSYNGSVPGPSFRVLKGRQTLVRFNNRLTPANLSGTPFSLQFDPCEGTRSGRPITVHLHGSSSLAPYDGERGTVIYLAEYKALRWAEDSTCGAETKDYYYPNWRAGFLWYHDHQLDITSENAYFGLSGMYTVHDRAAEGGCGEPWNLDALPDWDMQFKDGVLDRHCQLYYDRAGPHRNNLYGDINFVNGIPWPVATMEPRWQRFRWLVSSVSRPYKLRFVDAATGADVGGSKCHVIAGDGGIRRTPATFPAAGLFVAVAERYEVVCDFRDFNGRSLYLLNAFDDDRMKDVPFFCNSHLVMKIDVRCNGTGCLASPPPVNAIFTPLVPAQPAIDRVLSQTDINAALTLARNRQCTRTFRFGRRNGQWVINGETWHTVRIAAGDVGHNTWEVWCLETGGGWFHPIHIHLVDFYVLTRNREEAQVREYERFTPKDMVQLDPGAEVSVLVRFGAHRGEFMFHCHNLMHEDFEMMRSFHVVPTPGSRTAATALPLQAQPSIVQNLNVVYDLYDDPVYGPARPRPSAGLTPLRVPSVQTTAALSFPIDNALYRIYYPNGAPNVNPLLANAAINPWIVDICQPQRAQQVQEQQV